MQPITKSPIAASTRHHLLFAAVLVLAGSMGCSKAEPDTSSGTAANTRGETTQDRGSASMQLGDATWQARSARARLRNDTLTISASRTVRNGDAVQSERLSLTIPAYKGPGQYRAAAGSMFVRVGMDIPQGGEDSEAAAGKILANAMSGANMTRLADAEIEISAVSGGFVEGRFAQAGGAGASAGDMQGVFRARMRD
ncbi:MAG TPA: hypothetical protein PKC03_03425 [Dokdonella sp.]|jgi:hypothetical protein|nr:hypothetical protein [Dokdonella sp.]